MDEQRQYDEVIQLILGNNNRSAGRDYFEIFIPGSIKLALATWSKAKLDRIAKDNYRLFRYRFGFNATSLVREKVIDFQNKYDLSDSEIRWLKHAGHLRTTRTELTIDASRLMPIYGWIQVGLLSIVLCAAILGAGYSAEPEWKRALHQVTLGVLWFCIGAILLKMFVVPWRTLKESGAISAGRNVSGVPG